MAKIPVGLFRDWSNGETVTAEELDRAFEIIRTAINDFDNDVKAIARLPQLKGETGDVSSIGGVFEFKYNPETESLDIVVKK